MPSLLHGNLYVSHLRKNETMSFLRIWAYPSLQPPTTSASASLMRGISVYQILYKKGTTLFLQNGLNNTRSKKLISIAPRCSCSSNSNDSKDQTKSPFGYTRKDVLLIGLGVTLAGVGLKSGLEFAGVDPLQAGNVVQLVLVLGLTVGWISTYIFRVSNKEMTYAQQLRDYEVKVMEKRLDGLTEAELEALLEQVEEEKQRQAASGEQVN